MDFLARIGRYGLGIAVIGSGLMQVVNAGFVRLVLTPGWLSGSSVWAVGSGGLLVLVGLALLAGYQQRIAAVDLLVLLLATLGLRISEIVANPGTGFVWTNSCKLLALAGATLLLAVRSPGMVMTAAFLLGAFLMVCGGQHIAYAGFVDTMVPSWIPPGRRFWTLFSAIALLAGGLGLLLPAVRRPAGLLTGVMIFLWMILLHIPRSVSMQSAFELAGAFEALALAGTAWLVAAAPAPEVQRPA